MSPSPTGFGKTTSTRTIHGLKPRRRANARLTIERLEDRVVMATLDVTAGLLSYTASAGSTNNVFLNSDGTTETLTDSGDTIILTANAMAAGFTVDATLHNATGPDANVSSITINTEDGNDIIRLQSTVKPVSVSPTNNAGGTQTVFLGNASHGVQDITNTVNITNAFGTTTVNADDSANTVSGRNVSILGNTITGLTPSTVTIASGAASNLNIFGGTQVNTFIFGSTLAPTTTLNPGPNAVNVETVRQLDATALLTINAPASTVFINNSSTLATVLGHVDVRGTGSGPNLDVDDSADLTGRTVTATATQITGFNASELFTFSGLNTLTVRGGTRSNTFNIVNTPGITSNFNTGNNADTVTLRAAGLNSTVNINGNASLDNVTIGNAGLTSGILATNVNISNTNGSTNLTVDDSADATARTANIGQTTLTGLTPNGPINYVTSDINTLNVLGGNGGNTFTINNTGSNFRINSTTGTGNDTFIFTDQANLGGGTGGRIDGGAGSDTLDFSAYSTPVTANLNTTPQTVTAHGSFTTLNIENVISGGTAGNVFTAPAGVPSTLTGGPGNDTFIIPANAGNVTVNGGGGLDDLQIFGASSAATPDTFTQTFAAGRINTVVTGTTPTHTVNAGGINTLELLGGTGNTTATVDFSGGNPIPAGGETYTGGGGTNNILDLVNDVPAAAPNSFINETYNATGPGAGNISLDNNGPASTIAFSGLSPVIDSVSVQNYTMNVTTASINNISVTSIPPSLSSPAGPASVNGLVGTLIANGNSNLAGFESAAIANKVNVTLNSTVSSDTTVTVNDPTPGARLSTLTINTGAGADFINLLNTPTGVTLTANGGDGNDTFNVNAATLGGPTFLDGAAGLNSLIYDAGNAVVRQTPTTLQAGAAGQILNFRNITTISVNNIADLPLVGTATPITVQEGQSFTGVVGTFIQSTTGLPANAVNPVARAADFAATINWGDGTTTVGTVVSNGTGGFSVVGTHTYTSTNTPAATPFPITITVTHGPSTSTSTTNGVTTTLQTNGGSTVTFASSATVTDAAVISSGAPIVAVEGAAVPADTLVASFNDGTGVISTTGTFTATVNFGDGTTVAGTVTSAGTPGTFRVTTGAAHTFAEEGTYVVTTTITDAGGFVSIATSTAIVTDAPLTATGTAVIATNGNSFTGQVATFTDADPAGTISDYTATVNFGNGISAPGIITQPGGPGTAFIVTATQTFLTAGTFPIQTVIRDTGGATATATSTATVTASALTPNGAGAVLTVVEGQPFTAQLGAFTTADPLANLLQFAATIAWGDGTTSAGEITQSARGVFTVTGTHTYLEEGTNAITVTVSDVNLPAAITIAASATVNDAPLTSRGVGVTAVEGTAVPTGTLVASFSDLDPLGTAADYTATINWGDGTTTAGTVTASGGLNSGFLVRAAVPHTYADAGNYNVTTTITDAGSSSTIASSLANVAEAAVTVTGTAIAATEGNSFTGQVATFVDANPLGLAADFTAQVNFGDGIVVPGTITQPGGVGTPFIVTATHTFQTFGFGSFQVSTTVTDSGTVTAVGTSTATVTGAALTPGTPATVTGTEGVPVTAIVGTFTSANPLAQPQNFTATVTFGDSAVPVVGTITEDTNGVFTVTATHTFAEEGTTSISVLVRSTAAITTTLTGSATIADAPLAAISQPINTVEGLPFVLTVATFTDTDPMGTASDYTATINWGDGTITTGSAISFTASGGTTAVGQTFSVSAPHTYAEEGNYLVRVTINDAGGSTTSTVSTANVADAALIGTGVPVSSPEGVTFINAPIATFTDQGGPEVASSYVATIDFGDGTPAIRGLIALGANGTTFTVFASHNYAQSGVYTIHTLIQDSGGASTVVLSNATIGEVFVPITGNLDPGSDSGVSNSDKITNVKQPLFTGTAEAGSIVSLFAANGLGTIALGTGIADPAGHYAIRSAVAIPDGTYVVYSISVLPGNVNDVTGPIFILGANGVPPLVIDTVGPVVTETIFRRPLGSIMIAFQDFGGGLTTANIQDGQDYNFRVYGKQGNTPNLITSFNTIQSGGLNDPVEMFIRLNNGRPLNTGRYLLTVKSAGITDIAGNPLDGEFYGYLPSGNHKPGGDFQALLISNHGYTFRPLPTNSTATPVTPPGNKGTGFFTPSDGPNSTAVATPVTTSTPAAKTVAIKASARVKQTVAPTVSGYHTSKPVANHAVHDSALAHVTVSKKKK